MLSVLKPQFGRVFKMNDDDRRKRFMDTYKRNDHSAIAIRIEQSVYTPGYIDMGSSFNQGGHRLPMHIPPQHSVTSDTFVVTGEDAHDLAPMLVGLNSTENEATIREDDRSDFVQVLQDVNLSADADIVVTILDEFLSRF